jgi:hypothetical protein
MDHDFVTDDLLVRRLRCGRGRAGVILRRMHAQGILRRQGEGYVVLYRRRTSAERVNGTIGAVS